MASDDFEWDDAKAEANLKKHKVSFRLGTRVFDDPFLLIQQDTSEDYGEDRFIATGMVAGLLISVIYTDREDCIRVISARRANTNEQRSYHKG